MTRINVGIDPSELNARMLIAEHREIKRIPNAIKSGRFSMKGQPTKFTLGTGHVKFFYDKLGYLKHRYSLLYAECIKRKFNVTYFGECFEGIENKYMGVYKPSKNDRDIIMARISERLEEIRIKKEIDNV